MNAGNISRAGFTVSAASVSAVIVLWFLRHLAGSSAVFPDAVESGVLRRLRGPILDRYRAEGGPIGHLGLPISAEETATRGPAPPLGADREVRFERGIIWLESRSGSTKVQHATPTGCGS